MKATQPSQFTVLAVKVTGRPERERERERERLHMWPKGETGRGIFLLGRGQTQLLPEDWKGLVVQR